MRRLRYNEAEKNRRVEKTAARWRGKKKKKEANILIRNAASTCQICNWPVRIQAEEKVRHKSAVDSECGRNCDDWRKLHRWAAIGSRARADAFMKRSVCSVFPFICQFAQKGRLQIWEWYTETPLFKSALFWAFIRK